MSVVSYWLQYAPNWLLTQELLKTWHDEDDYWYYEYKKQKDQKKKIKKELMLVPWHPMRIQDWCMTKDEKKRTEEIKRFT